MIRIVRFDREHVWCELPREQCERDHPRAGSEVDRKSLRAPRERGEQQTVDRGAIPFGRLREVNSAAEESIVRDGYRDQGVVYCHGRIPRKLATVTESGKIRTPYAPTSVR